MKTDKAETWFETRWQRHREMRDPQCQVEAREAYLEGVCSTLLLYATDDLTDAQRLQVLQGAAAYIGEELKRTRTRMLEVVNDH